MTTDRPVFSVCSGVLAASLLLVLSPSAYADDMGGLWPVKDSAVVSAHEAGLDGSGVKVGMYDMQVVSDYPGLSDAKVKYQVGSFVDTDGEPAKCMLDDGDLQATVTSSDSGLYYSHGTAMLMWLVGNGKGWDGSQGVPGLVPKADVMFVTAGRGTVLMSAEDCQNLARQQVGPDLMSMVDWGTRVINMSNNGYMEAKSYEGMLDALRHGVIIVSGRSNDKETDAVVNGSSTDVMTGDPRSWDSFPGVIRNNEVGPDGNIAGISDVADANVNILSPGDQVLMSTYDKSRDMSVDTGGTSTGAAVLSGYLALVVQKWPDATGNQILQSLVRNTKGNDSGEAKLDPEHKRGYGQVDVARLLTVDPTQYPDVNPILEAQVTAAAKLSDDRSKWYAQDCSKNPDGVGDVLDDSLPVPCQAGEIGREYERQKAAWKKVEQCRSDGGSDCMRYSATATADETEGKSDGKSDGRIVLPGTGDGKDVVKSSGVPVWVWLAAGGVGIAVVAGGIVLAVVLSKRGKQGRRPLPDAAAAGPSPYAGPRQPVPGMAYPNRPYSPQYGGPGSRPVPQYQAPGPAQVPSQYRRNVGPVSPRYAQPQQQANPVPQNPVQPAQPYPQPPASQVPNVAGGYGQEQGYSPQQYPPQSDGRNKPGQGRHAR